MVSQGTIFNRWCRRGQYSTGVILGGHFVIGGVQGGHSSMNHVPGGHYEMGGALGQYSMASVLGKQYSTRMAFMSMGFIGTHSQP